MVVLAGLLTTVAARLLAPHSIELAVPCHEVTSLALSLDRRAQTVSRLFDLKKESRLSDGSNTVSSKSQLRVLHVDVANLLPATRGTKIALRRMQPCGRDPRLA